MAVSIFHRITYFIISALLIPIGYSWESQFYQSDWTPGVRDADGKFLHDFSYAGYHHGEDPIPINPLGETYNVSLPPYSADNTGVTDARDAIQQAINDASNAGGGIVYIPSGVYKILYPTTGNAALSITSNNVVIRGEGRETKLFTVSDNYSYKAVIQISPKFNVVWNPAIEDNPKLLTSDAQDPAFDLTLVDTDGYDVGDWIIIRTDATLGFATEHGVTSDLAPLTGFQYWDDDGFVGIRYYRQIKAIDRATNTITINVPTRYSIKTRDNARIYKVPAHIQESGIEDLTIGQVHSEINPTSPTRAGDMEAKARAATVINIKHSAHCWVKNVHSYKPADSAYNFHVASLGFNLQDSAFLTIKDCYMGYPMNQGDRGNGYMYQMQCNETLLDNCVGENSRHNFVSQTAICSGNVMHQCTGKRTEDINPLHEWNGASDFHRLLTHSCLVDQITLDGDRFEAHFRGSGSILHAWSTSQTVFWNPTLKGTYVDRRTGSAEQAAIDTEMWGHGYVIGSQGDHATNVTYKDYVYNHYALIKRIDPIRETFERLGDGATLDQQSLYLDQLSRRLNREELIADLIKNDVQLASVSSYEIPAKVAPEGSFTATVTMENRGTVDWGREAGYTFGLWNDETMPFRTTVQGVTVRIGSDQKVSFGPHKGLSDSHFFQLPASANGYKFEIAIGRSGNTGAAFGAPDSIQIYEAGTYLGELTGATPANGTYALWSFVANTPKNGGAYEIRINNKNSASAWRPMDDFKVYDSTGTNEIYSDPVEDNGAWVTSGDRRWDGDLKRVSFSASEVINTGELTTFTLDLTAPSAAGVYPIRLRMLDQNTGWFGEIIEASIVVSDLLADWKSSVESASSTTLGSDSNDFDGDGKTNIEEYIAGTDPTSSSDQVFSLEIAPTETTGMMTMSVPLRLDPKISYQLMHAGTNFLFSPVTPQPVFPATATGEIMMFEFEAPKTREQRFYRVEATSSY